MSRHCKQVFFEGYRYRERPMSPALSFYTSITDHQRKCQLLLNLADDKFLDKQQKEILFDVIKNQLTVYQVMLQGGSMPRLKYISMFCKAYI